MDRDIVFSSASSLAAVLAWYSTPPFKVTEVVVVSERWGTVTCKISSVICPLFVPTVHKTFYKYASAVLYFY